MLNYFIILISVINKHYSLMLVYFLLLTGNLPHEINFKYIFAHFDFGSTFKRDTRSAREDIIRILHFPLTLASGKVLENYEFGSRSSL